MKQILLIDDAPGLRAEVADVLRFEGFGVLEAADGTEGLQQAHEHLPDLILCDVMLPKQDGFAVLQALQGDPDTASIPVFLISARTEDSLIQLGLMLGAKRFITKPFSLTRLLEAIHTQLDA